MAKGKLKLKDRDKGYKAIIRELKKAAHGGAFAKVGVLGDDETEGAEITTPELAAVHEFGAPSRGIPERSFIRATFDAKKNEWTEIARRLVALIYDGKMTIQQALGLLGARAAADVKNHITQGPEIPPPASPKTLARKQGLTRNLANLAAHDAGQKFDARQRKREGPLTQAQHFGAAQQRFAAAGKAAAKVHLKRGEPRNLVDTGRLVGSITWDVVLGKKEGKGHG